MFASILGLQIGFWTYRKYTNDIDPLSLITSNDPDMDEITQILAQRHLTKLFTLGKHPHIKLNAHNNTHQQKQRSETRSCDSTPQMQQ